MKREREWEEGVEKREGRKEGGRGGREGEGRERVGRKEEGGGREGKRERGTVVAAKDIRQRFNFDVGICN